MSLVVIIVNFKTASVTIDCLRSIAPQIGQLPDARVIVVDNGSNDDSVQRIRQEGQRERWHWLEVVALERNVGFAAGNNHALAMAKDARHVLVLNSDTLVHDGCLAHCISVMEQEPTIGAMSCLLMNPDGTAQVAARRFLPPVRRYICALGLPWRLPRWFAWADPEDKWDRHTSRRDVDWIGGAFMFCRGDVLRALGGFDEDFFFYGEDYELCHRIHRAGYRIHYDARAAITHLGGGSSDHARLPSQEKLRHLWRGRYLAFCKCHGRLATYVLRAIDIANYALSTAVGRLRRKESPRHAYNTAVFAALSRRL